MAKTKKLANEGPRSPPGSGLLEQTVVVELRPDDAAAEVENRDVEQPLGDQNPTEVGLSG